MGYECYSYKNPPENTFPCLSGGILKIEYPCEIILKNKFSEIFIEINDVYDISKY